MKSGELSRRPETNRIPAARFPQAPPQNNEAGGGEHEERRRPALHHRGGMWMGQAGFGR
jgi:hypothetical protein